MPLLSPKLLKIGGPVLTGIGGVIATSSLISKSAEEKPEERLKTKALNDEDPPIEDWEDRNESEEDSQEEGQEGSPEQGDENQKQQDSAEGQSQDQSDADSGQDGATGQSSDSPDAKPSGDAGGASGVEASDAGSTQEGQGKDDPSGGGKQAETGEQGTVSEPKGGEDSAASGEGETRSDDSDGSSLGLENGREDAENLNVHGNAYGTRDERMTQQDIETVKSTYSSLLEIQKQLNALKD